SHGWRSDSRSPWSSYAGLLSWPATHSCSPHSRLHAGRGFVITDPMRPRSLVSGVALLASATLWLGWMLACGKKPAPAPAAQPAAQPAAAQPSTEVSPVVVDSLASFMHGTMELATLNVIVDQNMAPGDAQIIKQQAAICSAQPPG